MKQPLSVRSEKAKPQTPAPVARHRKKWSSPKTPARHPRGETAHPHPHPRHEITHNTTQAAMATHGTAAATVHKLKHGAERGARRQRATFPAPPSRATLLSLPPRAQPRSQARLSGRRGPNQGRGVGGVGRRGAERRRRGEGRREGVGFRTGGRGGGGPSRPQHPPPEPSSARRLPSTTALCRGRRARRPWQPPRRCSPPPGEAPRRWAQPPPLRAPPLEPSARPTRGPSKTAESPG